MEKTNEKNKIDYFNIDFDELNISEIELRIEDFYNKFQQNNNKVKEDFIFPDKYNKYKLWLIENNVIFKDIIEFPVCFGSFELIGAKAKIDIPENTGLFYVPSYLVIDSNNILQVNNWNDLIQKSNINKYRNEPLILMTIYLLSEYLNKDSFYFPYIDLIINISDPFILWNNNYHSLLDDENILEHIDDSLSYLKEIYFDLINKQNNNEIFQLLIKFYYFVISRNFIVNETQILIIPFADSLNHRNVNVHYEILDSMNNISKSVTIFDNDVKLIKTNFEFFKSSNNKQIDNITFNISDNNLMSENDYFTIVSEDKINKDSQIYNSYGKYSNEYFLCEYGFCFFNNKNDKVRISLHFPASEDLIFDKLIEVNFKDCFTSNGGFNTLTFKIKDKLCLKLISYIRFFYLYENDLDYNQFNKYLSKEIEIEIINRVIKLLNSIFIKKSKVFSLEHDLTLLENNFEVNKSNDYKLYYAITFRLTQKLLILKQIKYCEYINNKLNT